MQLKNIQYLPSLSVKILEDNFLCFRNELLLLIILSSTLQGYS